MDMWGKMCYMLAGANIFAAIHSAVRNDWEVFAINVIAVVGILLVYGIESEE